MDDPQDPFNKDINFFKSGLDQGKILGLTLRNASLIDIKSGIDQRLLNRWTSQLDLGCTTGWLERVVSVHNTT